MSAIARALWSLFLLAGVAFAQGDLRTIELRGADEDAVAVSYRPLIGALRNGGYGFAEFRVVNRGTQPHRVEVSIDDDRTGSYHASAEIEVDGGARARTRLLLPNIRGYLRVRARVVGGTEGVLELLGSHVNAFGLSVLAVVDPTSSASSWQSMIDSALRSRGATVFGSAAQVSLLSLLEATDIPDDWRLFSGFDLVLVDARRPQLDADAQAPLADFVLGGGNLVLLFADVLKPGRLADLARDGVRGFGRILVLDSDAASRAPSSVSPKTSKALEALLCDGELAPIARLEMQLSGTIHPAFATELVIPGLGSAPVRGFLFVILTFGVLVGPVNHFWCKRRRRLKALLITVPLGGMLATGLILLWGVVAQGFEVKVAERSLTVLDQPGRRAVSFGTSTMFAGSSIDRLRPRAGTWVWTNGFDRRSGRSNSVFEPFTDGSIDGGLVPTRLPTTLAKVAVGPERARLRFRRVGAAREVLADGEFTVEGDNVVLRDLEGRYFGGTAGNRLEPLTALDPSALIERVAETLHLPTRPDAPEMLGPYGFSAMGNPDWRSNEFIRGLSLGDGKDALRPGSYVACVKHSPGADDLGVSANVLVASHVVIGFIGPEDIVD